TVVCARMLTANSKIASTAGRVSFTPLIYHNPAPEQGAKAVTSPLDNLRFSISLPGTMTDPRYTKLARLLVNYSTRVKKGDRVLLDMIEVPDEFSVEMIRAVRAAGGEPLVEVRHNRVSRELLRGTNAKHASVVRDLELARMKRVQAYIALRGSPNISENSDVPSDRMALYSRITRPVLNYRVNKTRWCVLRWPSPSMAQSAGMST